MIPGVTSGVVTLSDTAEDPLAPSTSWPDGSSANQALTSAGTLAAKRCSAVIRPEATHSAPAGETPVVLAYPLLRDGQLFGVVLLRLEALDDAQQPAALHLLQWGSALLDFMLRQGNAADVAGRLATVIEATLVSLRQGRFQAAATAAVSHLVTALDCERVSVGFVRHNHVHIRAVSNTAQVDRRSNLVQDIEAAMEEAFDEGEVIVYPDIGKSQATHAHERQAITPFEKDQVDKDNRASRRIRAVLRTA